MTYKALCVCVMNEIQSTLCMCNGWHTQSTLCMYNGWHTQSTLCMYNGWRTKSTLCMCNGCHGHGHGLFILATYHKGKWTTHPNPLSPVIPSTLCMYNGWRTQSTLYMCNGWAYFIHYTYIKCFAFELARQKGRDLILLFIARHLEKIHVNSNVSERANRYALFSAGQRTFCM